MSKGILFGAENVIATILSVMRRKKTIIKKNSLCIMYIAQPTTKTNSSLGSHFSHGCAILSGGLFYEVIKWSKNLNK